VIRNPSLASTLVPILPLLLVLVPSGCEPVPYDRSAPGPEGATERRVIDTDRAPVAIGPYSQAIQAGNARVEIMMTAVRRP
jgi:hypothetical protein